MNPLRFYPVIALLFLASTAISQDDGYKTPPKDITDMLLANPTPNVSIDDNGEWMLFTQSNSYRTVEELARPELRLAGLRINPNNYAPSRSNFINDIYLKNIRTKNESKISGLPSPLYAGNLSWSPNNKKIAFTHTTADRADLYFSHGPQLPDPKKLLRGSGKEVRFIRLESARQLSQPDVEAFITAAVDLANVPLPSKGKGDLIIKTRRKAARR